MIRKLVLAGVASTALIIPAAAAAGAATHHSCGALSASVGKIRATNTTCAVARKVARADSRGKRYKSFRCTSRPNPAGANVTCHSGHKKVTFQVAD